MDTTRILLVDDDLGLLQALPHMVALRLHGVQVDTSDSAQGALEQLQDHDYDVIVTDIKMPGMDGLELLAKIQAMRPEIPTLLITGHGEQTLVIQALRGGAYDFIQKPIDRVYFTAALQRAIQTRQLRRQVQEQQQALALQAQSLEHLVQERTHELLAANRAMEGLVHDVLDISLIETNRFVLHRTRCNLVELCQHLLAEYMANADFTLTFECRETLIEAELDRDRMSRVFSNLLSNARRFSPKGSPITIRLQKAGEKAIFIVRDMGGGIADDVLPHIFKPFYRLPDDEVEAGSRAALGLELYISQKIVERHGGHIEVQSIPGSGTTFSVVLPLSADPTAESGDDTPLAVPEPSLFPPPPWLVS